MTVTVTAIDRDLLDEVLSHADWDGGEDELNDAYSGRGMYGDTCISINFSGVKQLGLFLFELGKAATDAADEEELTRALSEMVRRLRTDSMGTGIVAYFPGYRFGDS